MRILMVFCVIFTISSAIRTSSRRFVPSKRSPHYTPVSYDQFHSSNPFDSELKKSGSFHNSISASSSPLYKSAPYANTDSSYPIPGSSIPAGSFVTASSQLPITAYFALPATSSVPAHPVFVQSQYNQVPVQQCEPASMHCTPSVALATAPLASYATRSSLPFSTISITPDQFKTFSAMNPQITLDNGAQESSNIPMTLSHQYFMQPAATNMEEHQVDIFRNYYPAQ